MAIDKETQDYWRGKWVEALNSGDYGQTTGVLRDNKGFCCLGVLCDITKDEVNGSWDYDELGENYFFKVHDPDEDVEDNRFGGILPHSVRTLVGLTSRTGDYGPCVSLSSDNDSGSSFNTIAEIIERKNHKLFMESLL